MFQLTGKVGLDASGFYRALTGMKAAAAPLGNQIAKQLGSRFMSFFGAGAFVNSFRKTLAGAFEIRKEAGKLGLDTTTFQTLSRVANETGRDIKEMVDNMSGEDGLASSVAAANEELLKTGKIISEDTIIRLAELQDKFDDIGVRTAVVQAQLAEVGVGTYEGGQGIMDQTVASLTKLKGIFTGDKALEEAGNQLLGLSPNTTGSNDAGVGTSSAYTNLKNRVKEGFAEGAKEGVVAALKDPTVKEERMSRLEVSGATAMGGHFSKGSDLTPLENQLKLLNRTVYDLNRKLGNVL